ncbi:hypothetical protein QQF64_031398 [Cirrhinus molitorella]|uniref:Uncharacterized protein n=1 Tax=Cirrhinus molitorella TaxID=172907 RepID=A0ABR3MWT9_9TELE
MHQGRDKKVKTPPSHRCRFSPVAVLILAVFLECDKQAARSCEEGIALAFIVAVECKSFVLAGHMAQVPLLSTGLNPDPQLHA